MKTVSGIVMALLFAVPAVQGLAPTTADVRQELQPVQQDMRRQPPTPELDRAQPQRAMNPVDAPTEISRSEEEHDIGAAILHEVQNTDVLNLWPVGYLVLPKIEFFGVDLSIIKHLVMLWVASAVLVGVTAVTCRRPRRMPSGMANVLEAMVVFLRDQVISPTMGTAGNRYVPFLCTVFFFILVVNLLGLVPYGATATSNISVTAALALIALVMIQVSGIKAHGLLQHLCHLAPAGIPLWLLPIMVPVEILGQLTKPFALCIRLFANMTAGHIVILSVLALITVFKSLWIAPVSIVFALFLNILEIFIAALQAYIFTVLTALFMGMAIHPEH